MENQVSEKVFMEDEDRWPRWPAQTVKRKWDDSPNTGILWGGQGPTVFLVNLFDMPQDLTKAEKVTFESWDALIDAGWKID
ncbi:MAG: hypothetical protein KAJ19_10565 [Gammaproteobacteria bacterium]|nr:hypothetical protein [Gammaproteobacteria bacterium]